MFASMIIVFGCPNTVTPAWPDGPAMEAGTGRNPDGFDPFQREGAAVDAVATPDGGEWTLRDGRVVIEDQRYGYIRVGTYGAVETATSFAQAMFRLQNYPEDPRCVSVTTGAWSASNCSESGIAVTDPHPRPFPTSGPIDVSGGVEPVRLLRDAEGVYAPYYSMAPTFRPGSRVRVQSRGAEIPSIDQSVVIPAELRFRVLGAGGDVVRRDREVVIEWDATPARWVAISIEQRYTSDGQMRRVQLSAEAYADEGRIVIPTTALSQLRPSATERVTIWALPYATVEFRAGNWPVTLAALGPSAQVSMRVE